VENPDGSRTISWKDGIARTYSMIDIASMFLYAVETGTTNPILERLTSAEERRFLYRELEEMSTSLDQRVLGAIPR